VNAHDGAQLDTMGRRLNLGCGRKPLAGAVNLDVSDRVGADVVHDLNRRPWPLPDNWFDEVHMYDVIEHLTDVVGTLEEIHRICRRGAVLHVTVPHFSSANAFTDMTHRHWFGWRSFDPFDASHELSFYSEARFARRTARISFYPSLLNKVVWRLAGRWPERYERRWAWMFPAWFLYFELEVVK
jgi:SAM-dependent methyltransferase